MDRQTITQHQWRYFKDRKNDQTPIAANTERSIEAIVEEGKRASYFEAETDSKNFREELYYILKSDRAVFHSSVLHRLGTPGLSTSVKGQASTIETPSPLRIKDSLMKAVTATENTNSRPEIIKARQLFAQIIDTSWKNNAQGVEFTDTINKWHPTPEAGPIGARNYLEGQTYLRNCAYTGANINLMKYLRENGSFDYAAFQHTVELLCTALDIVIGYSQGYPTETIAKNTVKYRPLALGYINLGAIIMAQGIPYDSEEARTQAVTITALLTGQAYLTSAKLAYSFGPFAGFHQNREAALSVVKRHNSEIVQINARLVSEELLSVSASTLDEAMTLSQANGLRNAQVTCLNADNSRFETREIPTYGTEPFQKPHLLQRSLSQDTAIIRSLKVLSYEKEQIADIMNYIDVYKTMIHAPHLKEEHFTIFSPLINKDYIDYNAQVKMMIAVQPFISGGNGTPITLDSSLSSEDTSKIYLEAWRNGLKLLSFRNLSLVSTEKSTGSSVASSQHQAQKLVTTKDNSVSLTQDFQSSTVLPVRGSKTFTFNFQGAKGYITVCEDDNKLPTEVLLKLSIEDLHQIKVADDIAALISLGLRRGISINEYVKLLATSEEKSPDETSLSRIIVRILADNYLSFDEKVALNLASTRGSDSLQTSLLSEDKL